MAEQQVTFTANFDDSQMIAQVEQLIDNLEKADKATVDLGDSATDVFEELADSIDKQDKSLKGTLKSQADYKKRVDDSAKSQRSFRSTILDNIKDVKLFGVSLGDITEKLGRKQKALKSTSKALAGGVKGLRAFKVALISTGIGALVVAMGALVTLLTKTQRGLDFVNQVLDAGATVIDVFIERAAKLGGAIVKLFRGDFKTALEEAKESVTGITAEIREETLASIELTKAKQSLRDQERELNLEYEQQRAKIEELRNIGEDATKSATQRSKALQEALQIENDLAEKRTGLAAENLRIIKERNALGESLAADLDREAEAEAALAKIQAEKETRQREVANKLRAINKEQLAQIQALRDAYNGLLDDLGGRVEDANLSQLVGLEQLQAERALAIREVNNFAEEIKNAALQAGEALPEGFEGQIESLLNTVEAEFKKGVDKLRKGDPLLSPTDLLQLDEDAISERGQFDGEKYVEGLSNGIKSNIPIIDEIRSKILGALNINDAQLNFITESIGSTFANAIEGFDALAQAQLIQQDLIIEGLDNRIQETESLLEEERNRQEQGLANDVTVLESNLEKQQEARRKAEEERLELERKAARQRLIQNGIEQASNLVLAVAKLTAAEAKNGLVGVITAITGASLIFSLIAQAKAQAAEFQQLPAFKEGTPFVNGAGGPTDDKILARLSAGERVVPTWMNQQIGGKQLTNENLLQYFQIGKAVSEGKQNERQLVTIKQENNFQAMERAYNSAADRTAQAMIDYWKTRPIEYIDANGNKVIERIEGNVIKRQRISPK